MRRVLLVLPFILSFVVMITVVRADYFVPDNTPVKLLLLYNNNRNNYVILYHIEFFTYGGIECHISQFDLPIVIPPNTSIEIPITCKFPPGDFNIRIKLYFLVNNSYPADEINIRVHSGKINYYVTVNGYFINTTAVNFYVIHVGDIVKIIYNGNKFLGQSPIHMKILTYGIDKNFAYIILRAISEGMDSIYLPDLTHITFYIKGIKRTYNIFSQYEAIKSIYEKIVEENEKLIKLLEYLNKTKDIKQIKDIINMYNLQISKKINDLLDMYSKLNNFIQNDYKETKYKLEWYRSQYEILTEKLKTKEEEIENKLLVKINELENEVSRLNNELNSVKFNNFVLFIALMSTALASVIVISFLLYKIKKFKQKINELNKEISQLKESPIDTLIASEDIWKSEKKGEKK